MPTPRDEALYRALIEAGTAPDSADQMARTNNPELRALFLGDADADVDTDTDTDTDTEAGLGLSEQEMAALTATIPDEYVTAPVTLEGAALPPIRETDERLLPEGRDTQQSRALNAFAAGDHDRRGGTAWEDATDAEQERSLLYATGELDQLILGGAASPNVIDEGLPRVVTDAWRVKGTDTDTLASQRIRLYGRQPKEIKPVAPASEERIKTQHEVDKSYSYNNPLDPDKRTIYDLMFAKPEPGSVREGDWIPFHDPVAAPFEPTSATQEFIQGTWARLPSLESIDWDAGGRMLDELASIVAPGMLDGSADELRRRREEEEILEAGDLDRLGDFIAEEETDDGIFGTVSQQMLKERRESFDDRYRSEAELEEAVSNRAGVPVNRLRATDRVASAEEEDSWLRLPHGVAAPIRALTQGVDHAEVKGLLDTRREEEKALEAGDRQALLDLYLEEERSINAPGPVGSSSSASSATRLTLDDITDEWIADRKESLDERYPDERVLLDELALLRAGQRNENFDPLSASAKDAASEEEVWPIIQGVRLSDYPVAAVPREARDNLSLSAVVSAAESLPPEQLSAGLQRVLSLGQQIRDLSDDDILLGTESEGPSKREELSARLEEAMGDLRIGDLPPTVAREVVDLPTLKAAIEERQEARVAAGGGVMDTVEAGFGLLGTTVRADGSGDLHTVESGFGRFMRLAAAGEIAVKESAYSLPVWTLDGVDHVAGTTLSESIQQYLPPRDWEQTSLKGRVMGRMHTGQVGWDIDIGDVLRANGVDENSPFYGAAVNLGMALDFVVPFEAAAGAPGSAAYRAVDGGRFAYDATRSNPFSGDLEALNLPTPDAPSWEQWLAQGADTAKVVAKGAAANIAPKLSTGKADPVAALGTVIRGAAIEQAKRGRGVLTGLDDRLVSDTIDRAATLTGQSRGQIIELLGQQQLLDQDRAREHVNNVRGIMDGSIPDPDGLTSSSSYARLRAAVMAQTTAAEGAQPRLQAPEARAVLAITEVMARREAAKGNYPTAEAFFDHLTVRFSDELGTDANTPDDARAAVSGRPAPGGLDRDSADRLLEMFLSDDPDLTVQAGEVLEALDMPGYRNTLDLIPEPVLRSMVEEALGDIEYHYSQGNPEVVALLDRVSKPDPAGGRTLTGDVREAMRDIRRTVGTRAPTVTKPSIRAVMTLVPSLLTDQDGVPSAAARTKRWLDDNGVTYTKVREQEQSIRVEVSGGDIKALEAQFRSEFPGLYVWAGTRKLHRPTRTADVFFVSQSDLFHPSNTQRRTLITEARAFLQEHLRINPTAAPMGGLSQTIDPSQPDRAFFSKTTKIPTAKGTGVPTTLTEVTRLSARERRQAKSTKFTASFDPARAPEHLRALERVSRFAKRTNPLSSPEAWGRFMARLTGQDRNLMAPPKALEYAANPQLVADRIGSLTDEQLAQAREGMNEARRWRGNYESGKMPPEATGLLFAWATLSRKSSAYPQEAGFLDAFNGGIIPFVQAAAEGRWTDQTTTDYLAWSDDLFASIKETPGSGVKTNINAYGREFLANMGRPITEGPHAGKSPLAVLHEMLSAKRLKMPYRKKNGDTAYKMVPATGRNIRRLWWLTVPGAVGVNNKVLSFLLLLSGHLDVFVIDRVQARHLWDADARADQYGTWNIYDGMKGVAVADGLSGAFSNLRGLALYEAIEDGLREPVRQAYASLGRESEGQLGVFHWESWVQISQQEVGHGSIHAIRRYAEGEADPLAGIEARQGDMRGWDYGLAYAPRRPKPYSFRAPDGTVWDMTVEQKRRFIRAIRNESKRKKPTPNGVFTRGFQITRRPDPSRGWTEQPGVRPEGIDRLLRSLDAEPRPGRGGVPDGAVEDDAAAAGASGARGGVRGDEASAAREAGRSSAGGSRADEVAALVERGDLSQQHAQALQELLDSADPEDQQAAGAILDGRYGGDGLSSPVKPDEGTQAAVAALDALYDAAQEAPYRDSGAEVAERARAGDRLDLGVPGQSRTVARAAAGLDLKVDMATSSSSPAVAALAEADLRTGATMEEQQREVVSRVVSAGGEVLKFDHLDQMLSLDEIPVLRWPDVVGMKFFPTFADRTAAAAVYTGIRGLSLNIAVPLLGGPLFPLRISNVLHDVVWANRGVSIKGAKESKVASGATHMVIMLGKDSMHISNTTVFYSFILTFLKAVSDERISKAEAAALTSEMHSFPVPEVKTPRLTNAQKSKMTDDEIKKHEGKRKNEIDARSAARELREFPGFDDPQALVDYSHAISFGARKTFLAHFGKAKMERRTGIPMQALLDATIEPQLAGAPLGAGFLVVELDRTTDAKGKANARFTRLGTGGTTAHPDFPLGVRGKITGKIPAALGWRLLFPDHSAKMDTEGKTEPQAYRSLTLAMPVQEVTAEMAARLQNVNSSGVQTAAHARLVAAAIADHSRQTFTPPKRRKVTKGLPSKASIQARVIESHKKKGLTISKAEAGKLASRLLIDAKKKRLADYERERAEAEAEYAAAKAEHKAIDKSRKVSLGEYGKEIRASRGDSGMARPVNTGSASLQSAANAGSVKIVQIGDQRTYYGMERVERQITDPETGRKRTETVWRLTSLVNNEVGTGGVGETVAALDAVRKGATEAQADPGSTGYYLLRELGFEDTSEPGILTLSPEVDRERFAESYFESGPAGLVQGRAARDGAKAWSDDFGGGVDISGGQPGADAVADAGRPSAAGGDTLASRARRLAAAVADLNDASAENLGITAQDRDSARALVGDWRPQPEAQAPRTVPPALEVRAALEQLKRQGVPRKTLKRAHEALLGDNPDPLKRQAALALLQRAGTSRSDGLASPLSSPEKTSSSPAIEEITAHAEANPDFDAWLTRHASAGGRLYRLPRLKALHEAQRFFRPPEGTSIQKTDAGRYEVVSAAGKPVHPSYGTTFASRAEAEMAATTAALRAGEIEGRSIHPDDTDDVVVGVLRAGMDLGESRRAIAGAPVEHAAVFIGDTMIARAEGSIDAVSLTDDQKRRIRAASARGERVTITHNHPGHVGVTALSYEDVVLAAELGATVIEALADDGSHSRITVDPGKFDELRVAVDPETLKPGDNAAAFSMILAISQGVARKKARQMRKAREAITGRKMTFAEKVKLFAPIQTQELNRGLSQYGIEVESSPAQSVRRDLRQGDRRGLDGQRRAGAPGTARPGGEDGGTVSRAARVSGQPEGRRGVDPRRQEEEGSSRPRFVVPSLDGVDPAKLAEVERLLAEMGRKLSSSLAEAVEEQIGQPVAAVRMPKGTGGLSAYLTYPPANIKPQARTLTRDDVQSFAGGLAAKAGVTLEMSGPIKGDGSNAPIVVLNVIIVDQSDRNQGLGSAVMDEVSKWADEQGVIIALTPGSDFGSSVSRLRRFYMEFGFAENKAHRKDYRTRERMIRYPEDALHSSLSSLAEAADRLIAGEITIEEYKRIAQAAKADAPAKAPAKTDGLAALKDELKTIKDSFDERYQMDRVWANVKDLGRGERLLVIDQMRVREEYRRQGMGTRALEDLLDFADRHGMMVALTPDDMGAPKRVLTRWYKSHGFKPNKGRNKDFRFREAMVRQPQAPKARPDRPAPAPVAVQPAYKTNPRAKQTPLPRNLPAAAQRFLADSAVQNVVYHGVPDARWARHPDTAVLQTTTQRYGGHDNSPVFFFTDDRRLASTYRDNKPTPVLGRDEVPEPGILKGYLSITNPYRVQWGGEIWSGADADGLKLRDHIERAREAGNDGVIVDNVVDDYQRSSKSRPATVYVVFESNSFKSEDNLGTYDPAEPSILRSPLDADLRERLEEMLNSEDPDVVSQGLELFDMLGLDREAPSEEGGGLLSSPVSPPPPASLVPRDEVGRVLQPMDLTYPPGQGEGGAYDVVSLFDGISAGRQALENAGIPVGRYLASEVDKFAKQVSASNWPEIEQIGDVTKLETGEADSVALPERYDFLIGGSPCQDLRKGRDGLKGSKSKLFFDFERVFRLGRHKYFLFENNSEMSAADAAYVTETFGVAPILIDAERVGGMRRKRYFWTNIPGIRQPADLGLTGADIMLGYDEAMALGPEQVGVITDKTRNTAEGSRKPGGKPRWQTGQDAIQVKSDDKLPTMTWRRGKGVPYDIVTQGDRWRRLARVEAERMMGFPDGYTDAVSRKQALHGTGNSWSVPVVEHIFSHLAQEKGNTPSSSLAELSRAEKAEVISRQLGLFGVRHPVEQRIRAEGNDGLRSPDLDAEGDNPAALAAEMLTHADPQVAAQGAELVAAMGIDFEVEVYQSIVESLRALPQIVADTPANRLFLTYPVYPVLFIDNLVADRLSPQQSQRLAGQMRDMAEFLLSHTADPMADRDFREPADSLIRAAGRMEGVEPVRDPKQVIVDLLAALAKEGVTAYPSPRDGWVVLDKMDQQALRSATQRASSRLAEKYPYRGNLTYSIGREYGVGFTQVELPTAIQNPPPPTQTTSPPKFNKRRIGSAEREANFAAWFGDSKVVDEAGKPLVVYHWTPAEFRVFESEGEGFHFGTERAAIDRRDDVGEPIEYETEEDENDGFYVIADSGPQKGQEQGPFPTEADAEAFIEQQPKHIEPMAMHLRISNPIEMTDWGTWGLGGMIVALQDKGIIDSRDADDIIEQRRLRQGGGFARMKDLLIERGYDGIKYLNEAEDVGSVSWIAFSPEQVKNVENVGSYDPNNPDMYQARSLDDGAEQIHGYYQRTAAGHLIHLFKTGTLGTLFHEQGHLLKALLGEEEAESLLRIFRGQAARLEREEGAKLTRDRAADYDAYTDAEKPEELMADAFKLYLRLQTAPNGVFYRAFERLQYALADAWRRVRGRAEWLPAEAVAVWDGLLRPDLIADSKALQINGYQRATEAPPSVTIPKGAAARTGQLGAEARAKHDARAPIRRDELLQQSGYAEGQSVPINELMADLVGISAAERARRRIKGVEYVSLTRRTAVPRQRVRLVAGRAHDKLERALGESPETVAQRLGDEAGTTGARQGRTLHLTQPQAAGIRLLANTTAMQPMGRSIPGRLLDPDADLSTITLDELNALQEAVIDTEAGIASGRDRTVERMPPTVGYALLRTLRTAPTAAAEKLRGAAVGTAAGAAQKYSEGEMSRSAAQSAIDASAKTAAVADKALSAAARAEAVARTLEKWFVVRDDLEGDIDPGLLEVITSTIRDLNGIDYWVRQAQRAVVAEAKDKRRSYRRSHGRAAPDVQPTLRELVEDLAGELTPPLSLPNILLLPDIERRIFGVEGVGRSELKPSKMAEDIQGRLETGEHAYLDDIADRVFLARVAGLLADGPGLTLLEERALHVLDVVLMDSTRMGDPQAAFRETGWVEISQALAVLYRGVRRRAALIEDRGADIARALLGSGAAISDIGPATRRRLALAFYEGQWGHADAVDPFTLAEAGKDAAGVEPPTESGWRTLAEWSQIKRGTPDPEGLLLFEMVLRMRGREILAGLSADLARYGLRIDRAELEAMSLRPANGYGAKNGIAENEDFVNAVIHYLDRELTNAITVEHEGSGVADRYPAPAHNSHDHDAYTAARGILSRYGIQTGRAVPGLDRWKLTTLPDGSEVLLPQAIIDLLGDSLDRAVPVGQLAAALSGDQVGYTTAAILETLFGDGNFTQGIKLGVTVGVLVPNPAYYMGNAIGAIFQLQQGLGAIGAAQALTRNPAMLAAVACQLWGDGSRHDNGSVVVGKDGRIYTSDMIAELAEREGLDSSFIGAEIQRDLLKDIRRSHGKGLRHLAVKFGVGWQRNLIEAASAIDNVFRVAAFTDRIIEGESPSSAASFARKVGYDYSRLTESEKSWARKLVLFYSFLKLNTAFLLDTLLRNPSRVMGQFRLYRGLTRQHIEDEEPFVVTPEFMDGRLIVGARNLGARNVLYETAIADRTAQWVTIVPPIPAIDGVGLLLDVQASIMPMEEDAWKTLFSQMHPALKVPVVMGLGVDPFSGRDIGSTQQVPAYFVKLDRNLTGGLVVDQMLRVDPARNRYGQVEFLPGKDGQARLWWAMNSLGTWVPGMGRSMSTWEAADRADLGLIEGMVWASGEANAALRGVRDTDPVLGNAYINPAGPRPGLTAAEEAGAMLGAKPYPIPTRSALREDRARSLDQQLTRRMKLHDRDER